MLASIKGWSLGPTRLNQILQMNGRSEIIKKSAEDPPTKGISPDGPPKEKTTKSQTSTSSSRSMHPSTTSSATVIPHAQPPSNSIHSLTTSVIPSSSNSKLPLRTSTVTATPSAQTSPDSNLPTQPFLSSGQSSNNTSSLSEITGDIVGGIFGLIGLILLLWFALQGRKRVLYNPPHRSWLYQDPEADTLKRWPSSLSFVRPPPMPFTRPPPMRFARPHSVRFARPPSVPSMPPPSTPFVPPSSMSFVRAARPPAMSVFRTQPISTIPYLYDEERQAPPIRPARKGPIPRK